MQRHFYASAVDLVAVVEAVEARHTLQYTPAGLFERTPTTFPALSASDSECAGDRSLRFLVTILGSTISVRSIPQVAGGVRFAVDQLQNPDSIELTPSVWHSPQLVVYGRIATVSDTSVAKRIYGAFARSMERRFRRINAAWVGPEAEAAWQRGARLTIGLSSPQEYDLRELRDDAV